jgi:antitoxin component YwqK of YwqJK toxin-antitoxin module
MKQLTFLSALFFSIISCTKETDKKGIVIESIHMNGLPEKIKVYNSLYTTTYIQYHPNGMLASIKEILDDSLQGGISGHSYSYNEKGKLLNKKRWKNGKLKTERFYDGRYQSYFEYKNNGLLDSSAIIKW